MRGGEPSIVGQQRGPRLTNRDIVVLCWIAEQSAIRFDQLQRLLAMRSTNQERLSQTGMLSEHSTRRILRRWLIEGLVMYKIFHVREKGWIWLTEKGFAFVGLEKNRQVFEPVPSMLVQLIAGNEERLNQEERA